MGKFRKTLRVFYALLFIGLWIYPLQLATSYMFLALAIGSMFSRVCLRACHWLQVFPALATRYMVFPRLPLATCFSRACHTGYMFFFPALATAYMFFPSLALCHMLLNTSRFWYRFLLTSLFNIFLRQGVLCKPLLLAARGGHKDIVEFLLQKGASPTEEDTVK